MSKYFLIEACDIPWGVCERSTTDYKEAKKMYKDLKESLEEYKVPCTVKLSSIETYINKSGVIQDFKKTVYKKEVCPEYNLLTQLNNINKTLELIKEANQSFRAAMSSTDIDKNNYYHGIELVNLSLLTGPERDAILYKIETDLIARRLAKSEYSDFHDIHLQINKIKLTISSAIDTIKTKKSKRDKNNKAASKIEENKKYLASIGVSIESTEAKYIPEVTEVPKGYVIATEDTLAPGVSVEEAIIKVVDGTEEEEEAQVATIKDKELLTEDYSGDYIESDSGINSLAEQFAKVREKLLINE